MTGNGAGRDAALPARGRAALVASLRRLGGAPPPRESHAGVAGQAAAEERCDLCGVAIADDHRHLLHLDERRILCACEVCWALHSGDPEYRPSGTRRLWLERFELPDEVWAALGIPIGLAFFMISGATGRVIALYPSPAGATECELELSAWEQLCTLNPVLAELEADAEGLIVNRMGQARQYAIAPIDQCYRLVGMIKASWEGISGGAAVERAVPEFFAELREKAVMR